MNQSFQSDQRPPRFLLRLNTDKPTTSWQVHRDTPTAFLSTVVQTWLLGTSYVTTQFSDLKSVREVVESSLK